MIKEEDPSHARATPVVVLLIVFALVPLIGGSPLHADDDRAAAQAGLRSPVDGRSPVRIPQPGLHARSGYLWPYETGPYYSDRSPEDRSAPLSHKVITQVGSFVLDADELPFPAELQTTNRLHELQQQYFLVQFDTDPATRKELEARIDTAGGAVVERLAGHTIVARLNAAALAAIESAIGLRYVEPYHPALKLHPAIGRVPLHDPVRAASQIYQLDVMLWTNEDATSVVTSLSALGVTVLHVWGDQLRVEADRSLLTPIARLEPVRMIYEVLPLRARAEETSTTVQTGQYNAGATPFHDAGVDGSGGGVGTGQLLMVLDTGIQLDAAELSEQRTSAGTPGPAHRKVELYQTTGPFGGQGDLLGCDAPSQGGVTHGHAVSSVALGRASLVSPGYGPGVFASDPWGDLWKLDGVAPGARLLAYDGQVTPPGSSCSDPLQNTIAPGDLYNAGTPSASALGHAYGQGARVVNFSWGANENVYTANATDIDNFLLNNPDALVLVAAGDRGTDLLPTGGDGVPDPLTLGSPATTKSGLAIGASFNADVTDSPNSRLASSSVGPATGYTANRIAPQLMAPGSEPDEGGDLGMRSEFVCRSSDNDQDDPVECDVVQGLQGTSLSSAAAAGAALLVRDYFDQGFYPDRQANPLDSVPTISGALVKAILGASADMMTGENLSVAHRWNNEQGYGRIQLDQVLPLENWPTSPTGMIVHDTLSGTINVSHLSLPATIGAGGSSSDSFEVCNDEKELRIALAWTDPVGFDLRRNLDLTLTSPSGKVYRGNYFTDDNNRNGIIEFNEDCPAIGELAPNDQIDEGAWSLPICTNSGMPGRGQNVVSRDDSNPIEAVFLSPDPDGNGVTEDGSCSPTSSNPLGSDGTGRCGNDLDCAVNPQSPLPNDQCVGGTRQPEIGTWTVQVSAGTPFSGPPQDFALVISGGACLGSSVQWNRNVYQCAKPATIVVTESDDFSDPGCNQTMGCPASTIETRTTVWVFDENDLLVDCEGPSCPEPSPGPSFQQPDPNTLVFVSDEVALADLTLPVSGNGSIDIRDGYRIEVTYDDNAVTRTSSASVDCGLAVRSGTVQIRQFGQDSAVLVQGGCERAVPRQGEDVGFFEYGYPDRYMDADELLHLDFAFASAELTDLHNVWAELECVRIDVDSPPGCLPSGSGCNPAECGGECDPRRENNLRCGEMTILDSPQRIGTLPANAATSVNFAIQMVGEEELAGTSPTVELVLRITDDTAGKSRGGVVVSRQRLNVDEVSVLYNTDYPQGGIAVAIHDLNNNEEPDDPISDPAGLEGNDYRFETRTYGDLTFGLDASGSPVPRNQSLLSPWNFDGNDGGFRSGLASLTDEANADVFLIHNTGEDKNFNGIEDGACLADPSIACYDFPTDPRCPGGGSCLSIEDNAGDPPFTPIHSNQKGGCGWQTQPEYVCSIDGSRGCFEDADCQGTCQALNNPIVSTFDPCDSSCPDTQQCAPSTPDAWAPCVQDADCGNTVPGSGDCMTVSQTCVNYGGTCDTFSPASSGGVLHTGSIGEVGFGLCDGSASSQCEHFKVITSTESQLLWWSLWLTPVIEKVDQSIGPDGRPNSRVEITQWAWNQSLDLPDQNVAVTWEFDTDVDSTFPVDLVSDAETFGLLSGPFGPVTDAGAPRQIGGFSLFAPMGSCQGSGGTCRVDEDCPPGTCSGNPGVECHIDLECSIQGAGSTCLGASSCVQSDTSVNGTDVQGNNRTGRNACFFEGPGVIPPGARDELGFARPPDDDVDNDLDAFIDEFVTAAGPIRNMDISANGGPDMRLEVLEDFYGDTGNRFQGAIGMLNLEGSAATPASRGYGLAVDDMYVEWREIALDPDQTSCAGGGACASLEVPATYLYEGTTDLKISLVDATPYNDACVGGPRDGELCYTDADCQGGECDAAGNDCDLNDRYRDAVDDSDCDDDGVSDVVVRATSETTGDSMIVVLNQVSGSVPLYRGTVGTSLIADGPDLLYLNKIGAFDPTVTVTYKDMNDGQDRPCLNSSTGELQGRIQATAQVILASCDLVISSTSISDNGDGDAFADTDETVDLSFTVRNHCGIALTGCTAQLSTDSEWIECVRKPQVALGDLPADGVEVASPQAFQFKVDTLSDRDTLGLTPLDPLEAVFDVSFACAEFDTVRAPQRIVLPLDLNADDFGQAPTSWAEGFESGGLGQFTADNPDMGIPGGSDLEGLINAEGWRCQYSDPGWINSNSFGTQSAQDCYPGLNQAHANAVFWQVDGATVTESPDGGRAKSGLHSMYYGSFLTSSDGFTTPMGVVESVSSTTINLGLGDPQLSFWHQVSLADYRLVDGLPTLSSADRAVIQVLLLDDLGFPASDWQTLAPVQNGYDEQASQSLSLCTFDVVDDGNSEDDFFDPTDPGRRLGPSSTCFPAFSFGHLGDTDEPFSTANVGHATTRPTPTDVPDLGVGTWVESVFDLSQYRGRRIGLRFLVSAAKGRQATWDAQLHGTPGGRDDGWWIDDVVIDDVLAIPAQLSSDGFNLGTCSGNGESCIGQCELTLNPCSNDGECGVGESCVAPCPVGQSCSNAAEECGPICSMVTASVLVEPGGLVNPASVSVPTPEWLVTFDAASSTADACLDGTLQFRYCLSEDTDCDDPEDEILRSWTENGLFSAAPQVSQRYLVEARCSTSQDCYDSWAVDVDVNCPSEEDNLLSLVGVRAADKNTLTWPGDPLDVDVWTSIALTSSFGLYGDIDTAYPGSFTDYQDVTSVPMNESPGTGQFHCYLAKKRMELETIEGGFYCNSKTWRSGGEVEIPETPPTPPGGSFDDDPQSPIGRDRKLANALWGRPATGKSDPELAREDQPESGRRSLGRRGG